VIAGILVGGAGSRMGGRAKGMMPGPDGRPIARRLVDTFAEAGVNEVLLVGLRPEYASLGLEAIADEPGGIGPLGGLAALLRHAGPRRALAVACDMPFVSRGLVERLALAPRAPVVAPRIAGRWEPLFARYDATLALPVALRRIQAGQYALQGLLDEAVAVAFALRDGEEEQIRDWDAPEDVVR
jgi:molybdenum cofactor guanylyltransferase